MTNAYPLMSVVSVLRISASHRTTQFSSQNKDHPSLGLSLLKKKKKKINIITEELNNSHSSNCEDV